MHGIGGGVHIQWLYYHPGHEGAAQVSEVEHNRGVMTQVTGFSLDQVNATQTGFKGTNTFTIRK